MPEGLFFDGRWTALSRMMRASLRLGLAVTLACAVSRGFQYEGGNVRIEGRVYAEQGQIVSSARVRVESEEGDEIFETGLTPGGRYEVSGLRHIPYRVVATAEGYETFEETVDLSRTGSHFVFDIVMSLKKSGPPEPPPSLSDTTAPKAARKEYQKGVKALAANKIADSKAHFLKAVEDYPCYARAQTALAPFFIAERDASRAETALKQSIQCDAGFVNAYLKLGELYNLERRFHESVAVLQEGVRRDPALWAFHYQLGAAFYGDGKYSKAEQEYLRSESMVPPPPADVHIKLADLYSKEGAYAKAYAEMQAYLRADPNGRFASRVRSVMQQMESSGALKVSSAANPSVAPPKP